jgi:arabinogalactan oligomer/maltooligosaccharide transport system substrate-binding protein
VKGAAAAALALVLSGLGCQAPTAVRTVTLWHAYDESERQTLERLAREWNQAHPEIRLELVNVPFGAFSDKITAAIPNGNGPDLFIFAHDRLGDWAEAGLVEPVEFWVDEHLADRFDLQAISAMAYRGSLYGLPLAVKSLVLFYRADLVERPPATTDELVAIGRRFTAPSAGRFGLVYENTKLYGHAAWLHGFGGALFDDAGAPTLATPEAARALAFAKYLGGPGGIVPAETTVTLVATLFNEGRAPMALSGPWFIGGIAKGVPWAVAPLPTVSATGRPAAPFLGAEGVMMSTRARDKRAAFLVMDFLTGDGAAKVRALSARQVVPNRAIYADPAVAADRVLGTFRAQSERAHPMPSSPTMRMVWTPYDTAIQKVVAQGLDPAAALAVAQRELDGYLAGARR